jgi:predicted GNAT family N-acyltransferase
MFKIGSQVVATGRIVFNEHHSEAEHDSLVNLPEYIKKSGFIEASRFATHPEFRGGNLFPSLIQQIMKVALENNISWVVSNCEDSLVNIYLRFGLKLQNESFYTSFMGEKRLNLFFSNVRHLFLCKGVSLLYWSITYHDIYKKFKKDSIYLTPYQKIRMKIISAAAGVCYLYFENRILTKKMSKRKKRCIVKSQKRGELSHEQSKTAV